MNWLDKYIKENETGYFKDEYNGHWVLWKEDTIKHAFGGEREFKDIMAITRDEFIKSYTEVIQNGENQ